MSYVTILFENLEKYIEEIVAIPESEYRVKPAPDKWSKIEIFGHLVDSAHNNHRRFLLAANQDHLIFDGYDQDQWVIRNQYNKRNMDEVVGCWVSANSQLSYCVDALPQELLFRKTTKHSFHKMCFNSIPEGQASSLDYLLWDYFDHMDHHLAQLLPHYKRTLGPYTAS